MTTRRLNFKFVLMVAVPVLVAAAGVYALHGAQVERSADVLLRQADRAEREGDPGEALSYLDRYIGLRPDDADAAARSGLIRAGRAKDPASSQQAFLVLERALRLDPKRDDVRREAVAVAMRPGLGRFSDAAVHLRTLLAAAPDDAELHFLNAQALEGDKKYREAEEAYRDALGRDPGLIDAHVRLAALYRDRLDNPRAADRIMGVSSAGEGIVRNNPDSARAYLERGLYRATHEVGEAGPDIVRALELAPDDPDVLLASADAALTRGDAEAARGYLERARERSSGDLRVYRGLARLDADAGAFDDAEAAIRRGLEAIAEDDAEGRIQLLWGLAELEIEAGRVAEAREAIAELKKADVRPGLLNLLEGKARVAEGRWRDAVEELETARTLLTEQADLTYQIDLMLGACSERLGNPDRRLAAYRRAVATQATQVPGRLGLAASLADLGRIDEAIPIYRSLIDRVPGIRAEVARLLLTKTLARPEDGRNWGEAERALADAQADQPDSVEVALLRVRALVARDRAGEARDLLTRAVQQNPEDAALRAALAGLIGRGGDRPAALAELDELERRQGDSAATRLARISYWASQPGDDALDALAGLEGGLERFGDDDQRRLLNALIFVRRQLGDLTGAERLLGRLSRLVPDDLAPRLFGMELTLSEGTDAAKQEVAREVDAILKEKAPEDLASLTRLFDLALASGAEAQAEAVQRLLRRAEGDEGPLWRQAESRLLLLKAERLARGDERRALLARARTLLDEASRRRPGWSPIPVARSFVEELDGDPAAAIRALEQARELGVRDRASLLRLYRLYLGSGRTEQADALVAEMRSLGLGDDDGLIARLAAESTLREADPAAALEQARAAVSDDPTDYRDHLWLAPFLLAADRLDEAEDQLRKAVDLAPAEPAPRIALVRFLADRDRRDEATREIDRAREELPADASALALARCHAAVGDLDRAFEQFDRAIAATPDDPAPLRAAAETALIGNRLARAEADLARLARLGPAAPDDATWARRTLAIILAASGDPAKRREAVGQLGAAEAGPGGPAVDELRVRAQVLALQVDPESRRQAIRLLEQIVDQRASGTPDDRFLLAQLYELDGQWNRARQRMVALLAEAGDNPSYVIRYIGWLLVPEPGRGHEADPEAARPWVDRLDRLSPGTIQAAEARARYLAATDKLGEAVAGLERHAGAHPDQLLAVAQLVDQLDSPGRAEPLYRLLVDREDDPTAPLRLAGALERQGDGRLDDAEDAYRRYVDGAEDPQAAFPLAGFLARRGRLDDALALCERVRAACPPNALATAVLSLVFRHAPNSDQLDRAARLLEAIRSEHPGDVEVLFQLANLRSLQGRDGEAERLFRDSVAGAPGQPGPLNNLAWFLALKDRSRAAEALDLVNRAIADVGPDPNLLDTRSLALLGLGRVEDAVKDLETAISRSRQPDPIWYVHLAQAHLQANRRAQASEALANARRLGLDEASIPPLERSAFDQLVAKLGGS